MIDRRRYWLVLCLLVATGCLPINLDWSSQNGSQSYKEQSAVAFGLDKKNLQYQTTTTVEPVVTSTTTTIPPTTTTSVATTTTETYVEPEVEVTDSGGVNWDAIAECESHGDWHINTGNGYYGGLQFSHSTWISYGGGKYAENAHLTSKANQIAIASGMSLSHWPHCGRYG